MKRRQTVDGKRLSALGDVLSPVLSGEEVPEVEGPYFYDDTAFDSLSEPARSIAMWLASTAIGSVGVAETEAGIPDDSTLQAAVADAVVPWAADHAVDLANSIDAGVVADPLFVGLGPRYATAVDNLRRALEEKGTNPDRIVVLTSEYAGRLRAARAATIARTELIGAANLGRIETWRQAEEIGPNAGKEWVTGGDDPCLECEELDGEQVYLDEQFSNSEDAPPLHPSCECELLLVADMGETPHETPELSPEEIQTEVGEEGLAGEPAGIPV